VQKVNTINQYTLDAYSL